MAIQKKVKKRSQSVATAPKSNFRADEYEDMELDSEIDNFASKVHSTLLEARSKMSAAEAAEADKKAKAIFARATSAVKSSRHSA
jgi:hypothetical protein